MRRQRRGVSLIETILALGILSIVLAGALVMMSDNADRTRANVTTQRLQEVTQAARNYLKANTETLIDRTKTASILIPVARTTLAGTAPAGPSGSPALTSLQGGGFLPADFVDVNPFGQSHAFIVRQPSAGRLEALVTTVGGREIPDAQLGVIATGAGAEGGFVPAKVLSGAAGRIVGTSGGWGTDTASWTVSATGPSKGHAVAAMALDEGAIVADYLYRRDIGIPEANRMRTDLSMGNALAKEENSINDIRSLTTTNGGAKSITMAGSFLSLKNADSLISLNANGLVEINNNLKVNNDINAGHDIDARNNITAGQDIGAKRNITAETGAITGHTNITAEEGRISAPKGNVEAGLDVIAKGEVRAGGDVRGKRFFDIDNGYVVDPSGTSRLVNLQADKIQLSAKVEGGPHKGTLDPNETLGSAVSRLWGCRLEYRYFRNSTGGGSNWSTGVLLDGKNHTGAPSSWRVNNLTDECTGQGCGLQMRTVCDGTSTVSPPDPGSTGSPINACPVWTTGVYPNCTVKTLPDKCPVWTTGSYPNCVPETGGSGGLNLISGLGSVSCPANQRLISCGAIGPGGIGPVVGGGGQTGSRTTGYYGSANGFSNYGGTCTGMQTYEQLDGGKNGSGMYEYASRPGGIAIAYCSP